MTHRKLIHYERYDFDEKKKHLVGIELIQDI